MTPQDQQKYTDLAPICSRCGQKMVLVDEVEIGIRYLCRHCQKFYDVSLMNEIMETWPKQVTPE